MNTQNNQPTQTLPPMTNREMAALLFNIASCLRDDGNQNPWRTAAYERGARALMGLRTPASEILQTHQAVPFRRRQHIGKKLQAKIREMTTAGALAQYHELLATLPAHRANLMTVGGIGPKTADRIHQTLGITTAPELLRAARDGSLRAVHGMGAKRVQAIAALPIAAAPEWNLFSLHHP